MPRKQRIPVITSSLAVTGTVAAAFSYQITASNNPTSFSAAPLPSGLTVDSVSGLISGNPAAGTDVASPYGVIVSARNSSGTGRGTLNVTIKPAPPPPVVTAIAKVSWGQIDNATGYKISWGKGSNAYTFTKDVGNSLQTQVGNLTSGTTYYFSGKSYNATEESVYGNEVAYRP